jgi:hypothetical protein
MIRIIRPVCPSARIREFFETYEGKLIDSTKSPAKARYVRFYSKETRRTIESLQTEIEIYGM